VARLLVAPVCAHETRSDGVTGPLTLKERSRAAPVLASAADQRYLAWTGTDLHVNIASSDAGGRFGPAHRLGYQSWQQVWVSSTRSRSGDGTWETVPLGPALAATWAEAHLAWTGRDGHLNVLPRSTGWDGPVLLGQNTQVAPALAAWEGGLVLAWTGTDRRVNVAVSRGRVFGPPTRLEAKTSWHPAVGVYGERVAVAWTGTDNHVNVMFLQNGSVGPAHRFDHTSMTGPALCPVRDELILAWAGTDRRVNLATVEPNGGRTVRLHEKTIACPSVCADGGALLVAWTGTDNHINVLTVDPPH
jgi:hypothetical protein